MIARDFEALYGGIYYNAESAAKSHELAAAIKGVADESNCFFLDASTIAFAGDDGIHFSEAAHAALADAIENRVHEVVSS